MSGAFLIFEFQNVSECGLLTNHVAAVVTC